MKKSKLIELLNTIEGDPDIVFWNGFVGDFQDVSKELVEGELTKQTFANYKQAVEWSRALKANDPDFKLSEAEVVELKKCYKRVVQWEDNEFVTKEDIKKKHYSKKRVVFLQAEVKGKTYHDRLGKVSY